jgi:ABC-type sugar transport system permease subunit
MTEVLIYSFLFFLLSPGLLLNLPGTKGGFFDVFFFKPNAYGGIGLDTEAVFMTQKTSFWSILAHTVVFLVLALIVKMVLKPKENKK